jgi:hypothetical protein
MGSDGNTKERRKTGPTALMVDHQIPYGQCRNRVRHPVLATSVAPVTRYRHVATGLLTPPNVLSTSYVERVAVALCLVVIVGCRREPTIEEVEQRLGELFSHETPLRVTRTFDCEPFSGDWEYVCQVTSRSARKPRPAKRVGVKYMDHFRGKAFYAITYLPPDGPVPTLAELEERQARVRRPPAQPSAR